MTTGKTYDVAVVGAGVFGAWTAYELQRSGNKVVLVDAYGPAHSRASSGGESRIIRMGYGPDELYTRWSMRALALWQAFFERVKQPLFYRTGVLWMARENDTYSMHTLKTLKKLRVHFEKFSRRQLERNYPQIAFGSVTWGLLEPESGALMARRAVAAVVDEAVKNGVEYLTEAVVTPTGQGRLPAIHTRSGKAIAAAKFVFACGPWLPKLFPELLQDRIRPSRQEVYFFGVPAGDSRFASPALPVWADFGDLVYGFPNLEGRGLKLAIDRHGPAFDPDDGKRIVTPEGMAEARRSLERLFPAMKDAPVVETRVCQYENTSSGDFLIDRHPDFENVWIAGGGSGHGFKHGPVLGEYVTALVKGGGAVEPRFSLATKGMVEQRNVY
jgi:monomeric sarcosine oxidase